MSSKKGPDPGTEIRDPEKIHPGSGSRIQGVKKHRIPDPDPQHCSNQSDIRIFLVSGTGIQLDIRQVKSGIRLDTEHQKRPDYPARYPVHPYRLGLAYS
jgi:hypothetical protein